MPEAIFLKLEALLPVEGQASTAACQVTLNGPQTLQLYMLKDVSLSSSRLCGLEPTLCPNTQHHSRT